METSHGLLIRQEQNMVQTNFAHDNLNQSCELTNYSTHHKNHYEESNVWVEQESISISLGMDGVLNPLKSNLHNQKTILFPPN